MKTSILIAGVCLLALTSTVTGALHKKQNLDCVPSSALQSCLSEFASETTSVCSGSCRDTLLQYFFDCGVPRAAFDALCDTIDDGGDNDGGDSDGGDNDCLPPSSTVQSCLAEFASGTSSVCSGSCRDTLLQYYSDCGVPRATFDALCDAIDDEGDNDGGDNDCLTPSSAVQSCLTQRASQSTPVCSDSCRDTLLQYFSDCGVPRATFDAFCDAIDDEGDNDGGDNDCLTPSSAVQSCLTQLASQSTSVCSGSCRDTLLQYFSDCGLPSAAFDLFCDGLGETTTEETTTEETTTEETTTEETTTDNDGVDNNGGDNDGEDNDGGDNDGGDNNEGDSSAATVGVTLFTIVSAVVVAVGN